MPNFTAFDASERQPRPGQTLALNWLNDNWTKSDAFAMILSTGAGKSAIARAIQVATGADILTPSNLLVNQYSADYPHVNALKGKNNYMCKSGLTCRDWQQCGFSPCEGCPYQKAKERVFAGDATLWNPMSFYYTFLNANGAKPSKTMIIDEAHMLPSMVLMLCGKKLKRSDFKFNERCCNELYLIAWLKDQIDRIDRLSQLYSKQNDMERVAKCRDEIESLSLLKDGLEEDPQNYVIWIDKQEKETYLNVRPLFPPRFLMNRIVGGKKLILMSGTLFEHDIKAIVGDKHYKLIEQPSPIPVANRRISWRPTPFPVNFKTDPKQLAEHITKQLIAGKNTMIHSTYALSKRLAPYMPSGTIINTQEDKEQKIDEFKRKGGIFLASGCAEGVDFRGDLCRLNIEPQLSWPQLMDPAVVKRKAMQDGNRWYALETLKISIQRAGRSTRGPDDESTIINTDPNFKRLVVQNVKDVPKYFLESIDWTGK